MFREVLSRETILPKWRELLITLETPGRPRRGRGGKVRERLLGEQFALPLAVESLRGQRNAPAIGEVVTVSAADPLNLVGIVVPGERWQRTLDGLWRFAMELPCHRAKGRESRCWLLVEMRTKCG